MICRVCGKLGHFVEVHDVKDLAFRQRIIETLGEDIYSSSSSDEKNKTNAPSNGASFPTDSSSPKPNIGPWTKSTHGQKGLVEQFQGPLTEKEMLEKNSAQVVLPWNPSSNLDDWYH